jgi:hypothetical protein
VTEVTVWYDDFTPDYRRFVTSILPVRALLAVPGRVRSGSRGRSRALEQTTCRATARRQSVTNTERRFSVGSVIKKRRKRMAKKKHRKLLKKTRVQRRNKK